MNAKITRMIMTAVLLLSVTSTGCTKDEQEDTLAAVEQQDTEAMSDTQAEEIREPIEDLDEAYEEILNECSKDFIGGYNVDESFLTWIYANYGKETILALANEVLLGEQNVNCWYELTGNSIHVLWLKYCQHTGLDSYVLEHVYWKECAADDKIVLDFTGDFNFAEGWPTTEHMKAQSNGIYDCFSGDLLQEMTDADIMVMNNEFTYSTGGEPLEGKSYTFRADPKDAYLLNVFGADIVSLANNHAYDYGPDALVDTMETLEEVGIPYVGAGRNLEEAKKPVYFVANGKKIAIVSATQIERSANYTKEATETAPGVLKTLNPDKYLEVIGNACKNSDYVIAFVHWGTEHEEHYGADQANLAKQYVEAGADAVIGGHTHCLQGMQYIDGVPVIYSLGNFWFTGSTIDTGVSQIIINTDGSIDFRFIPCIQSEFKTSLVTKEADKERIYDYMESISTNISIDEEGYVTDLSGE